MVVTIYAHYGVLAHEKQCVFSTSPSSEPLRVIIPDDFRPRLSVLGEILVDLPNGFNPYFLRDVLAPTNGAPVVKWVDANRKRHQLTLAYAE